MSSIRFERGADRTMILPSGGTVSMGLADYRFIYRTYRSDPNLQAAMERHTWIMVPDDHETSNDCYWDYARDTLGAPDHPYTTDAQYGNSPALLRQLRAGEPESAINDYVAQTVGGTRSLGLKCINPGGCEAFKENLRVFGLDDEVPFYGLTSRQIFQALQKSTQAVGVLPTPAIDSPPPAFGRTALAPIFRSPDHSRFARDQTAKHRNRLRQAEPNPQ